MNNTVPLRIFIGLKVAPDIAQQLAELAHPLKSDEVRLVPSSDNHLTLVPPRNETHITDLVEKLRIAVCEIGRFLMSLEHLRYGEVLIVTEIQKLRDILSDAAAGARPRLIAAWPAGLKRWLDFAL
jgi:hypothetical protein